jgi:hypothetical protein
MYNQCILFNIQATYLRDLVSKRLDMLQFLNGRGYSIYVDNVLMEHIIRELTGESWYTRIHR